jgi:hypothetical protein
MSLKHVCKGCAQVKREASFLQRLLTDNMLSNKSYQIQTLSCNSGTVFKKREEL